MLQTLDDFLRTNHEELEMKDFETLGTEDIMRIFGLSRVSIYRRLRAGREGGHCGLPLPLPTGGAKRSLRWNTETVKQFLENANDASQTPPEQKIESAAQRQRRHNVAMKQLERFGIKIPKKEQE